jgi:hypothetical protein
MFKMANIAVYLGDFFFGFFLFFFGKWGRRVYRGTKVLGYGRGRDNTTAKDRSHAGSKGADSILG